METSLSYIDNQKKIANDMTQDFIQVQTDQQNLRNELQEIKKTIQLNKKGNSDVTEITNLIVEKKKKVHINNSFTKINIFV